MKLEYYGSKHHGVISFLGDIVMIALSLSDSDVSSALRSMLEENLSELEGAVMKLLDHEAACPTSPVIKFTKSVLAMCAGKLKRKHPSNLECTEEQRVRDAISRVAETASTLASWSLSPNEKLQAILATFVGESDDMDTIRKFITVLVDGAAGDFSAIPRLLELLGTSLSPGDKDKIVSALTVLKKLGEGSLSHTDVGDAPMTEVVKKVADELFEQIDASKSGCISFDRFMSLVNHIGIGVSEADARQAFKKVDADGSGTIDKEEFRQTIPLMKDMIIDFVMGRMGLRPGQVIVFVVVLLSTLAFFLAFILLGMRTFSGGDVFTAVVGGAMPMAFNGLTGLSGGIDEFIGVAERILNSYQLVCVVSRDTFALYPLPFRGIASFCDFPK